MQRRLIVLGASGHGKVVAETATAAGWSVVGFSDANPALTGTFLLGVPIQEPTLDGLVKWATREGAAVAVAIGSNATRRRLVAQLASSVDVPPLIHPTAWVSPTAAIGPATVVFAGAIVQAMAHIGTGVILNTGCTVDHDGHIGDFAHLSPGVHLGGTVHVGEEAWLGVGVSVRNNVAIGARTVVGVGAAVVSDLPEDVVAYGVPARPRSA